MTKRVVAILSIIFGFFILSFSISGNYATQTQADQQAGAPENDSIVMDIIDIVRFEENFPAQKN